MPKTKTYHTGQKAPNSGQYKVSGTNREVTLSKGERVPPTPGHRGVNLVDRTKHKR